MTYALRCKQLGLTFEELDMISSGMVWDMLTEMSNDNEEYAPVAQQAQFNEFIGK
jgi:hypothetical protein